MDKLKQVQQYWNERPCNIKHSNKKVGTKEYFEEVMKKKYFAEPHTIDFAEFSKWKGKKVLDIGCGIGTIALSFAKAGAIVTAFDLSNKSLSICKNGFESYGLKGTFINGNAEHLSDYFDNDEKFDLIWSFGVIHHTPNPENVFKEIRKLIKPDGEARIMLYSKVSFKMFEIMKDYNRWDMSEIKETIELQSEAQYGCPVTYTYSFNEIRSILQKYQFKEKKIWKDHIFIWDIENYKQNKFVKNEYWKNVDDKEIKQWAKELGWHTMIIAYPL